jgi:hypothetical protein
MGDNPDRKHWPGVGRGAEKPHPGKDSFVTKSEEAIAGYFS